MEAKTERGDYEYKKEKAINKVAETLEECLEDFSEDDQGRIREAIANYTVGYLGVSFELHARRG